MPVYEVPRQVSEMIYPWQVEQKARIKEVLRRNGSATKVLQRRQYRSFVENDEPLSNSHIILSSHAVDHVPDAGRGEGPHHHALYVMKKDGSRNVRHVTSRVASAVLFRTVCGPPGTRRANLERKWYI